MLHYNLTNLLELPSDNNKKDISLGESNNSKERLRPVDMNNDKEDIKLADISKQKPATLYKTIQNRLLGKSSLTFGQMTFSESEFSAGTLILDTRYKYFRRQNNNLFYLFNGQLNYILTHYFLDSETTKRNINKFLTNPLMKLITKNLSYRNADE